MAGKEEQRFEPNKLSTTEPSFSIICRNSLNYVTEELKNPNLT